MFHLPSGNPNDWVEQRYPEAPKAVEPYSAKGLSFSPLQLFGMGPLWSVTCGECMGSFQQRLPRTDYPGLVCPHCHTVNTIPVTIGSLMDD